MSSPSASEALAQPPAGAVRHEKLDAWEICERDASGERHGDSTLYREDGSLLLRCRYEGGKRSGAFTSYHPSGELSSEGSYANDLLDGPLVRYASSTPGSEPLRNCCVPQGARELRANYRRGSLVREVFLDAEGRPLLPSGELAPARATGVPLDADFDENESRWVLRLETGDDAELRRTFDLAGRLREEADVVARRTVALRSFDENARLACARAFDREGRLHGPCRLVFGENAPYADPSICEERGAFDHGQSTGLFHYYDAGGRRLFSKERGEPLTDEHLRELLAAEGLDQPAATLFRRADELLRERRVRQALITSACACAKIGSVETLGALIAERIVPLKPELARARAAALDGNVELTIPGALDALLAGADPASVFRLLAALVPSVSSTARYLVEAALLLSPEGDRARVTRALIRLEQGDVEGALDDVSALGPEYTDAVDHVRGLARILFAKPEFTPPREPPSIPEAELAEVGVEQPLGAVRRCIALYATRLREIRNEIRRQRDGAEPAWLPADFSHLLESGPIELRRYTATISEDDGDGIQQSDVEIDETLALSGVSVKTLMTIARADFDALCWLCWAVGLDDVALPTALVPRTDFAAAVNDAMLRCWRAHDQRSTAGLLSKSRAVPDFAWEGLPVERLTLAFTEVSVHQYRERRAMFFWLMFSQNLSPFQNDLRKL